MISLRNNKNRRPAVAGICLTLLGLGATSASPSLEGNAVLIYKIGKFVHWPEGSFGASGALKLCIVGQDDFATSVEGLGGQKLQGRVISIERHAYLGPPVMSCHIAFISESERDALPAFLALASRTPVLTISEMGGFAAQGGMVGLTASAGALTIEVNSGASSRAGLAIGAPLMQCATLIADVPPGVKP